MSREQARIALPQPTSRDADYNGRSMPQYVQAVESAGGIAVPIALGLTPAEQSALMETCWGTLLPGSPADVDPCRYGEDPHELCAPRDCAREATDNLLLEASYALGKPLLGVCFGLQSLNVWRQGSLVQHLPGQSLQGSVDHAAGPSIAQAHGVAITPGSRLANATQSEELRSGLLQVNSSHHQAASRPGSGLRIAATSAADGVVEALESTDPARFVVAVQWHPERSYAESATSRALFAAFIDAAREWHAGKSNATTNR